jgi:hypothetical protein
LLLLGACHRARIRATRWLHRNDVATHTFAISRRVSPESCISLSPERAQGMPGARCARSLVCEMKKHTSIVTTVTPETPGIPCAMVLTASFALSSVTGLSCHRCGPRCFRHRRQRDASVGASGPHDFSVRFCAVRQRAAKASIASRTQRS